MHFLAAGPVSPPGRWALVRDLGLLESLARRGDIAHRRGDPLGRRQTLLCLTHILFLIWEDALHPPSGPVDAALDDISSAIRQDPGRRWTVTALAARASLSRAQFTMSVTQVAAALGYSDVAYFSRQYKWITGRTPGNRESHIESR